MDGAGKKRKRGKKGRERDKKRKLADFSEGFKGEVFVCWPRTLGMGKVSNQGRTKTCVNHAAINCVEAISRLQAIEEEDEDEEGIKKKKKKMRGSIQELNDRMPHVKGRNLSTEYELGIPVPITEVLDHLRSRGVCYETRYPLKTDGHAREKYEDIPIKNKAKRIYISNSKWFWMREDPNPETFRDRNFKQLFKHPILGVFKLCLYPTKEWQKDHIYDEDGYPDLGEIEYHVMMIAGYGWHEGRFYYIVKNSWGPDWGIHGYGMIGVEYCVQAGWPCLVDDMYKPEDYWPEIKKRHSCDG